MKPTLRRLGPEYGMLLVLLLLGVFFSIVTLREQSVTGEAAVGQVVEQLMSEMPKGGRVLLAVRDRPDERMYGDQLKARLQKQSAGIEVVTVIGEPGDVRVKLDDFSKSLVRLDAIAGSEVTAAWLVFEDMAKEFPSVGNPKIIRPQSYRWPNFLKADNLLNIANQIAVIAIIAIGMTMVIITGGIDLSVGSLLALAAVITSWFIREHAGALDAGVGGMIVACVVGVVLCGVAGAFTGTMITRLNVPPFIVTLAMMLVTSGFAYTLADGQSIYQIPESFTWLGRRADLFGIPNAVVLMLVLYICAHLLMTHTKMGRHLYAVGGNREAAQISGVPVKRVLLFAYVVSGLLAGLGGVVMASQLKSGSPTYGSMYELYVIAAVVVGGSSLSGGKGSMLGTLTGAFIIAVIQNGMNLTNVESYTQKVVLGGVILGAVLVDKMRKR